MKNSFIFEKHIVKKFEIDVQKLARTLKEFHSEYIRKVYDDDNYENDIDVEIEEFFDEVSDKHNISMIYDDCDFDNLDDIELYFPYDEYEAIYSFIYDLCKEILETCYR